MFKVRIETIREQSTNGPTYMNGRQDYRNGLVSQLGFDHKKGLIQAQVSGAQANQVRIILTAAGELHDSSCTCSAFSSYWGNCRHIVAVLLACVDTYGSESTHIVPAAPVDTIQTDDSSTERKSRMKTREFMNRMNRQLLLHHPGTRQTLNLVVELHCMTHSGTLPWLTLSIGNDTLHAIDNVEQFAEALVRQTCLEVDRQLIFDPAVQLFAAADQPLLDLIIDAYENDYKAVFGTSHTASRERCFILNANRFAHFLGFSGRLRHCSCQINRQKSRQPITISTDPLPLSLFLQPSIPPSATPFILLVQSRQAIHQLTASRNVFLVDECFYLPSREAILLLDPLLSILQSPGSPILPMTQQEAARFIGQMAPLLEQVCKISLDPVVERLIVRQPLRCKLVLDQSSQGIRGTVRYQYGEEELNPFTENEQEGKLVIRDPEGEAAFDACLTEHDFVRQAQAWRLPEGQPTFALLNEGLTELREKAEVLLGDSLLVIKVQAFPALHAHLADIGQQQNLSLELDWDTLQPEERTLYLQALKENRTWYQTLSGDFRLVDLGHKDRFLPLVQRLAAWGYLVENLAARISLPRYRAVALAGLLAADQIDESIHRMTRQLVQTPSGYRLPASIKVTLRPYQRTGFQWLCTLYDWGLGGILADDMGLGKTLQAIALVARLHQRRHQTALIIAPTSLIYNWQSEFEKFAPALPVLILDGNRVQRSQRLEIMDKQACIITSYALLRRDIDEISHYRFSCCFLDEAQNIKNPDTLNARSVKQIQADGYFALTGTPIENSLTELWSIFDYILPGYLYNQRQFQNQFEWPIVREQQTDVLEDLHRLITPFILRRMKRDVLKELPDKIETEAVCDMTDVQRDLYESFLAQARADFEKEIALNGFTRSQIYILALLTRLRQICCHPGLFSKNYNGGSGKLQLLDELLTESLASGHRVLIFSQFTHMLDIIREQYKQQEDIFYIDGQVPAEERLQLVQRFNQGEGRLFLISLRAGGTGLNLTGADTVIHYDPWWNPAVEEQATDRAYRIGQENVVQVIKLYTRHSIEEKILSMQQRKKKLVDSIIRPDQTLLSKLTLDEVRSLFDLPN